MTQRPVISKARKARRRSAWPRAPRPEPDELLATMVQDVTTLMIYAGDGETDSWATRTGGIPLTPAEFAWPQCAECDGYMQFLAQVILDDLQTAAEGAAQIPQGVVSIFMCQNDPGLCDEWDATSGGNRALLFASADLTAAQPPPDGETTLREVFTVHYIRMDGDNYGEARDRWAEQQNRSPRDVLGQLGGVPWWIQSDETPCCPRCHEDMAFLVQLEEGRDWHTSANFGGGGCAYAFMCRPCQKAAFLWQR